MLKAHFVVITVSVRGTTRNTFVLACTVNKIAKHVFVVIVPFVTVRVLSIQGVFWGVHEIVKGIKLLGPF